MTQSVMELAHLFKKDHPRPSWGLARMWIKINFGRNPKDDEVDELYNKVIDSSLPDALKPIKRYDKRIPMRKG